MKKSKNTYKIVITLIIDNWQFINYINFNFKNDKSY